MTEDEGRAPTDGAAEFTEHRRLLFTVAYEITGSVSDAEDVVQESYLRWAALLDGQRAAVRAPRAYLARIATRQALNRVRSRSRLREDYVGPWLPDPLVTSPDIADDVILAESVSMAMMLVVQSLTPDERAVFVLHEVFGFAHDEIAEAVGKSPAAVRQIAHRARSHVQSRRPRAADRTADVPKVAQRFMIAASTGDLQGLMDVLAPDVVLLSDGGGKVKAATRPVVTADHVARLLVGLRAKMMAGDNPPVARTEPAMVNGRPGALLYFDGVLDTVATVEIAGDKVVAVYLVRNPDKLYGINTQRTAGR